ncbi:MAG TPA: hypothetical protein VFQ85_08720 [Mycobacteriales bacterium]|jgi:hypothetical protein|nr:hypothetical protein [Mycobacteriales bacterium]
MRLALLGALTAGLVLTAVPAHAAAGTVTIDEECPAGYTEHLKVYEAGHTIRYCSIP